MDRRQLDITLRWLDGRLSDSERQGFEDALNQSGTLRAEVEALHVMRQDMRQTLEGEARAAANPYLADRVLSRLQAGARPAFADELALWLGQVFRPVALAGLLIAMLLAGYNVRLSQSFATQSSTAEAVLALPPVSAASVYDLDVYAAQTAVTP